MYFSLAFVSLVLAILAGVVVFYAAECVLSWVNTTGAISTIVLRTFDIYSGIVGRKIK